MVDEPARVEAVVEAVEHDVVGPGTSRPKGPGADASRGLQILGGIPERQRLAGRPRGEMDSDDVDRVGAGEVAERRFALLRGPQLLLRRERDTAQVPGAEDVLRADTALSELAAIERRALVAAGHLIGEKLLLQASSPGGRHGLRPLVEVRRPLHGGRVFPRAPGEQSASHRGSPQPRRRSRGESRAPRPHSAPAPARRRRRTPPPQARG